MLENTILCNGHRTERRLQRMSSGSICSTGMGPHTCPLMFAHTTASRFINPLQGRPNNWKTLLNLPSIVSAPLQSVHKISRYLCKPTRRKITGKEESKVKHCAQTATRQIHITRIIATTQVTKAKSAPKIYIGMRHAWNAVSSTSRKTLKIRFCPGITIKKASRENIVGAILASLVRNAISIK